MNPPSIHRLALLFTLIFATVASAAQLKHVAVFEAMADADSVMTESELRYLTNELRKQAVNALPTAQYSVMTRDNILSLIPPDKNAAECFEGLCLVEIGRNVGADYAVQGTVYRFGSYLALTVEVYETMSGKLLQSITANSKTVDGFLDVMSKEAAPLFVAIRANDAAQEETVSAPPAPAFVEPPVEAPVAPLVVAPPPVALPEPPPPEFPQSIDPQVPAQESTGGGLAWNHWVGIGLDVLGAAAFAFGLYANSEVTSQMEEYKALPEGTGVGLFDEKWQVIEDAKRNRSIGYIAGGVLLASGLTFHIAF
jgi:hypothetical protein